MSDSPRVPPIELDDATDEVRSILTADLGGAGAAVGSLADHNIFRTLAQHPQLFRAWLPFGGFLLTQGVLPARDRELLILRTGANCHSSYEWGQHLRISALIGISDEEIARVAKGPAADGWSEHDIALLNAADELCARHEISDPTWAALERTYDRPQMIEATMLVGHYVMVAGCLNSFGVELDDGLEPLPGE
jgi:4-carboxymuconolactone decarboxylase